MAQFKNQNTTVAYARWTDFYSNDDTSTPFFIKVDPVTNEVNFYYQQSKAKEERVVLRNAKETAKTIRIIKEILTETSWAKYLEYDDLEAFRKEIMLQLVTTTKTFPEIKRAYLSSL